MFDKFGEFDSAAELNAAAEGLRTEGDEESLKALALENGLDEQDAEDYMDGYEETLATELTAAAGKLRIEAEDLKLKSILRDWVDELSVLCVDDPELAKAVRRKGKSLTGYMAALVDAGWRDRVEVDSRITDQAKDVKKMLGSHKLSIGMPDKRTRKQIAHEYYGGK